MSGEAILAAIIGFKKEDAASSDVGVNADGTTSALKFARGDGTDSKLSQPAAKVEAVAGGIALRSLINEGQLAANTGVTNDTNAVQSAGITAVNKLLGAVEDIIKKTVKNVIGTAKQKIDEARAPKSEGQK